MSRLLVFSIAIVFSFFLQTRPSNAQAKRFGSTNLEFIIPGEEWKLLTTNKAGRVSFSGYQREPGPGEQIKPSISYMVEQLDLKPNAHDYFLSKIRQMGLKPSRFFGPSDRIKIGALGGYLCKAFFSNRGNVDSTYFGCIVTGNIAISVICEAPVNSFHLYDQEFIEFLGSIKYAGAESANKATDNKPQQGAASVRPSANPATAIKMCDYFPLVDRMQFTYKRINRTGEHTITEVYNPAKEKQLKSGITLKGFRIRSTEANRDNTVMYYYCENGSINMYAEMPGYDTHIAGYKEDYSIFPSDYNKPDYQKTPIWQTDKYGTGQYLSFTELKSGSVGDHWTDVQVVNGNPVIITSKIVEADLSLTAGGKTYAPVIHIQRTVKVKFEGELEDLNTQDVYYAKGIGKIKAVEEGEDVLMGSYTTTQELISTNLKK